jgi:hypothetical protein
MCAGHPAAWHDASGRVLKPDEQLRRVVLSDPLGFLLAVLGGKPILAYRLEPVGKRYRTKVKDGNQIKTKQVRRVLRAEIAVEEGVRVIAEYWTPSMSDRIRVAHALAPLQVSAMKPVMPTMPEPADPDPERTKQIKEALAASRAEAEEA